LTRRVLGWLLALVVLPLVAVACGLGWLYLLRSHHLLASGPKVKGALALQQLALGDAQPLLRTVVAWVIAGLAAGALLRAAMGSRALALLPAFAAGSLAWLIAAGAASDALANNLRVSSQVGHQLSSEAIAVSLAALVPAAAVGLLAARAALRALRAHVGDGRVRAVE
jgi:hypothetical protein